MPPPQRRATIVHPWRIVVVVVGPLAILMTGLAWYIEQLIDASITDDYVPSKPILVREMPAKRQQQLEQLVNLAGIQLPADTYVLKMESAHWQDTNIEWYLYSSSKPVFPGLEKDIFPQYNPRWSSFPAKITAPAEYFGRKWDMDGGFLAIDLVTTSQGTYFVLGAFAM